MKIFSLLLQVAEKLSHHLVCILFLALASLSLIIFVFVFSSSSFLSSSSSSISLLSMFLRKQLLVTQCIEKRRSFKAKETQHPFIKICPRPRYIPLLLFSLSAVIFLLICRPLISPYAHCKTLKHHYTSSDGDNKENQKVNSRTESLQPAKSKCQDRGMYFYVYDLPAEFNVGLLGDCSHLNIHTNMCPYIENRGLGQPLSQTDGGSTATATWFATNQFTAEMIFHARLENHPCRTPDPSLATLFYVPFYGGLHMSSRVRVANYTARDELPLGLMEFLRLQPWWKRNQGKDHFLVLGRTAWDFMRNDRRNPDLGQSCLLNLPPVQNMSVLVIERHPRRSNQHGIPYPSYFHPSTPDQMQKWQQKMKKNSRPYLFSFIGAPRKQGNKKAAIRNELIRQCSESKRCKLVLCHGKKNNCQDQKMLLQAMTQSQFCLQAPGDSYTRRSTFDSVVAGCIPVFFSRHSAYTQYAWYFPKETSAYSVYLDGNGSRRVEEELLKIPGDRVHRMRETVISLIPRISYANPSSSVSVHVGFEDAVDVALASLAERVLKNL